MKKICAIALVCVWFCGCAGYHIGEVKPNKLKDIQSITVPTFANKTLLPRIEVLVTDTVIKQFHQDGTYKIAGDEHADAILQGDILKVTRLPARSVRGNVLATTEFKLNMRIRYKLLRAGTEEVLAQGDATGDTSFFVSSDVTTDERQALPLAAEQVATRLVSQLSEGW